MNTIAAIPFFKLGPWTPIPGADWLKIHSFGMFVAIGLLVCLAMATWRGEKKLGFNGERVQNYGLWLIAVGWIFAHVLNMIFYHPAYVAMNPWSLLKVWGSISSYGGLIGGIIGFRLWTWYNPEEDGELWLDHSVWTLTFAWFFGRVGCSSVHDHMGVQAPKWWPLGYENFPYGTDTVHVPWEFLGVEIYFDKVSAAGEYISHSWAAEGVVRHDLGFYEMLWWGVIVLTMLWLDRKPRRKGLYTAVVPIMYAPCRFLLDFLRAYPQNADGTYDIPAHTRFFMDLMGAQPESIIINGEAWYADTRYWGLTPAQYISMALFAFGIYWAFRIRDREPIEWEEYQRDEDDRYFRPFGEKLKERLATRETKRKLGKILMIGGGLLLAICGYLLIDLAGSRDFAQLLVQRVSEDPGLSLPTDPFGAMQTTGVVGALLGAASVALGVQQWRARLEAPSEEQIEEEKED